MDNDFYSCDVFFDSQDLKNASLYIFRPAGSDGDVDGTIHRLVEAGLWTPDSVSQVRDDQRDAYAKQLERVDRIPLEPDQLFIAGYNHPKYPSDDTRWREWVRCLTLR